MTHPPINELTIRVYEASDGGYMYDIYGHDHGEWCKDYCSPLDGGQCTTTIANALDMARDQAQHLIKWGNESA